MDPILIISVLFALALGLLIGWLVSSSRSSSQLQVTSGELQRSRGELEAAGRERGKTDEALSTLRARLEGEQQARATAETRVAEAEKKIAELREFVEQTKLQMEGSYAKLSQDALGAAIERLNEVVKPQLDGAKGAIQQTLDAKGESIEALLLPVREMLDKYRDELQKSELMRQRAYGGIEEQIKGLLGAHERAQSETAKLVNALRVPTISGSWGENTLRNCVELAGMSEFCDFSEQETVTTDEGRKQRPDLIIRMPNHRVIAVDSKAPMDAYLEAAGETDETRKRELLAQHARNLRKHVDALSRRDYQSSIGETLDFTVLFMGGEQFLSAALLTDPSIFEYAVQKKVYLASPTILLPLLRAVASGWKAERAEASAQEAMALGLELYMRFVKVFEHIEPIGRYLSQAIDKYNEAVSSVNKRLVPHVAKMQAFVGTGKEMPEMKQIESALESANLDDPRISLAPPEAEETHN